MEIEIRRPDDWHLHLRDGAAMTAVLHFTAERFARAIVMPNLKPPVTTTADAAQYRARIVASLPRGANFTPLMTLYLTDRTPPEEIERARESGFVHGCKLYPAGATTHADSGVTDIRRIDAVLARMAELNLPLLVHGEVTAREVDVFERETRFIAEVLAPPADFENRTSNGLERRLHNEDVLLTFLDLFAVGWMAIKTVIEDEEDVND